MKDRRDQLPFAGLAVGVWALLPKISGPALGTTDRVEFADHIVPSAVILLVSLVAMVLARKGRPAPTPMFGVGIVIALAGLWMVSTHVPLVAQAIRGEAPWDGTVFHSLPSATVMVLGLLWTASYWADAAPAEGSQARTPHAAADTGAETVPAEADAPSDA